MRRVSRSVAAVPGGLSVEKLGTRTREVRSRIDPDRAKQYAAATNDDNPAYTSGACAPPVFGVVPTWEAIGLAVADVVPPEQLMMVVHGEQDMHFHRPLVPGRELVTVAEAHSIRVGASGTRFTTQVTSTDGETGDHVLEQFVTMFIRGLGEGDSAGPDKPDHTFDASGATAVAEFTVHVDADQTFRYHEASGDPMPIHLDDNFAKSVGLPGIIAHGLCTMAMTSQAVVRTVAGGDPGRVERLAVRFSKNVFPGDDVTTTIYGVGGGRYGFEATTNRGVTVISNGLAQVAD